MAKLAKIQNIGNSRGIILTKDMLAHLGVEDKVEVHFETGKLILQSPRKLVPGPNPMDFDKALEETIRQYDNALLKLAILPDTDEKKAK